MGPARFIAICALLGALAAPLAGPSWALELQIPDIAVEAGAAVRAPVMIDEVDNLAGIKLVIHYDPQVLEYKDAEKSPQTNGLMHVVNSKNPGRLVVVMAGARGVKGKGFPVITLGFQALPCNNPECRSGLRITEAQLMSDKLKDLDFSIKEGGVTVHGAKPAPPAPVEAVSGTVPNPEAPVVPGPEKPAGKTQAAH